MQQLTVSENTMLDSSFNSHHAIVRSSMGIRLSQVETPMIGAGELLLAPLVAGLCGTDIQILRGERNDNARVIGHEGVAEIVQAGSGCPDYFTPGTRVLINPTNPHDSQFLLGHNVDGLFQEYIRIPASVIAAGLVIPVVQTLPLTLAPLIEPLAAVFYAFQLMQPQHRGESMIIYGDGIVGHLALLLARICFGKRVAIIFVHHHQEGLNWSRTQKIHGDLDLLFNELSSFHIEHTNLPAPGSALIATPRHSTLACLSHAVDCITPHGYVDLLGGLPEVASVPSLPGLNLSKLRSVNCGGVPAQGVFANTYTIQNKPLILCGHRGVSNDHLLQAMTELTANGIFYQKLISHILDLKDAARFMDDLSKNGPRQINSQRVMKLGIRINSHLKRN